MNLGKIFRSLFRLKPRQEPPAGWAFTIQANLDLMRRIVFVHIADEAKAEAAAIKAFEGMVSERQPVTATMMADVGVPAGGHKLQTGNGWSFSVQGAPGANNPLVFVYLSDERDAEAALRKTTTATILLRSEVPRVVLVQDLGMKPGEIRAIS